MEKERLWLVFVDERMHPLEVYATGAEDAERRARTDSSGTRFFPHRADCKCEEIEVPCVLGQMEARLRGTPLGSLCGL
jgi:hypothetical protein